METFREEHYEVEQMYRGRWSNMEYEVSSRDEAEKFIRDNHRKNRRFRIIRCTTVREVIGEQ